MSRYDIIMGADDAKTEIVPMKVHFMGQEFHTEKEVQINSRFK